MKPLVLLSIFLCFVAEPVLAFDYTAEGSLSVSEAYNDNIFFSSQDRDSDFITFITPGIDLSVRSLLSELTLRYNPSFSFYTSHDELNEIAHLLSASGNITLTERLNLTVTDTFVKSSEISDIRTIPDLGPITGRIERRLHTISSEISYKLKDNLFCTLGALYFDTDYKEAGFFEGKSYSGTFGITYRSTERTAFSANARYAKFDYRPSSDATEQDYMLGFTHKLTPTVTFGISGGPIIVRIEDIDESDTIFGGNAELTKTFRKGEATLSFWQTVLAGIETGVPVRDRSVRLSLSRRITDKLTASVLASYSNFKSVIIPLYDSNEIHLNTDVTYRLSPRADLILSYNYIDYDDEITDTGFFNNIVFLTLRLNYSRKL